MKSKQCDNLTLVSYVDDDYRDGVCHRTHDDLVKIRKAFLPKPLKYPFLSQEQNDLIEYEGWELLINGEPAEDVLNGNR